MREKINCVVLGQIPKNYLDGRKHEDLINIIIPQNEEAILELLSKNRTIDSIITIGETKYVDELNSCSFDIRKKWWHFDNFDINSIENSAIATFTKNIDRKDKEPLFSFFTCTYHSKKKYIERLYNSLKNQTYNNWNWWIIDDTPSLDICDSLKFLMKDPRVNIIKNITNHASIGFNKHLIAMACDGDYLVEIDHDDEVTEDCLHQLARAFEKFPESKFVYSDSLELVGEHVSVGYGNNFSYGQGIYRTETINGWTYNVAITTPTINAKSVRGIHAQPNHVRCWEKNFYHRIGGHNQDIGVCDDMELFVRTFLNTRITHINKVLYIQHEEDGRSNNNTQGKRFAVIQSLNNILSQKYDSKIHDRILQLGFNDPIWKENEGYGDLYSNATLIDYGFQFYT